MAENERTNIRQRQAEGIAAAPAGELLRSASSLAGPKNTLAEAAQACNMPVGTFYGKARKFEKVA